jgi:5'-3' exonuclease
MRAHLVDGTYELFRHHYGLPKDAQESRTAATRGVVATVLGMLADGATHVGVATDHVIESFRNGLWPGYKSSAGMPDVLLAQFPLVEEALVALGVKVWPMVDLEADDAMASAAAVAADDPEVEQVAIWTPDKDLGQCVRGNRVVQVDRRNKKVVDEEGVIAKFGVAPASIPDYLALVGDSADGFPGLPGFGAKSAAAVLRRFGTIEAIPESVTEWDGVNARGAPTLAATLAAQRDLALLFKDIATLRVDYSLLDDVSELEWRGPTSDFEGVCARIDAAGLLHKAKELSRSRRGG